MRYNLNTNPEYELSKLIKMTDYKLALAESCTGGLVSHLITNVPGSSDYFLGSVVTYSNEVKNQILGVKDETLTKYGAVSKETVLEMAEHVRSLFSQIYPFDKIIGASISGIAGPDGGSGEKPVGLVWIGISYKNHGTAHDFLWNGSREENKFKSAVQCLNLINSLFNKQYNKKMTSHH